jgi:glycosyltransferase involved in cell wall biosynthesis
MNILSYVHLRNIYRATGVGRVARELTQNLALQPDTQVAILADRVDYDRIISKVEAPWPQFTYHFMRHETSRQQALWYLTNRPKAEDYWPAVDLVHCTAESYVPVRRARLAVSCHDAQHFEPGVHKMSPWLMRQRIKWKLLFDRLNREADMFHMISEFAAERTAHYFPAIASRLKVVPNAASESFFRLPTLKGKEILQELGLEGRRFVLTPGGLQHRKNAELILKAWPLIHERNPDLLLVVINWTDPVYLDEANALAPSCVLAGFQEEEELVALYAAAELVWFPTRYDGFGMPVIEAMASGTPVVSSNTTGIPEVAGTAAILLSPDRPTDHIEAICGLLNDERACEELARMGRERAEGYRWSRSAQTLAGHFRSLL